MERIVEIPKVKKVEYESVWVRGCQQRTVTKVRFRDGSTVTFTGPLDRQEAVTQAYIQKGTDMGMAREEAEGIAAARSIRCK